MLRLLKVSLVARDGTRFDRFRRSDLFVPVMLALPLGVFRLRPFQSVMGR